VTGGVWHTIALKLNYRKPRDEANPHLALLLEYRGFGLDLILAIDVPLLGRQLLRFARAAAGCCPAMSAGSAVSALRCWQSAGHLELELVHGGMGWRREDGRVLKARDRTGVPLVEIRVLLPLLLVLLHQHAELVPVVKPVAGPRGSRGPEW
jgi:hypothetical protein